MLLFLTADKVRRVKSRVLEFFSANVGYTQGDSDVISFHIYANRFSPPVVSNRYYYRHLVGKTLRNVSYSTVTQIRFVGIQVNDYVDIFLK